MKADNKGIESENSKKSISKIWIVVILAMILLLTGFYFYYFYPEVIPGMASRSLLTKGPINILVVGLDDIESVEKGRISADSLVLCKIDESAGKINLTNIIPAEKEIIISEVSQKEDIEALVKKVEVIADQDIEYYITLSYSAFTNMVDNLDGIEINLEEKIKVSDLELDLKVGANELDGVQALNYSRWYDYRKDENDRIQRQQQIMKAIIEKAFKNKSILDMPQLFKTTLDTYKMVNTNIELTLIRDLARFMNDLDEIEINYHIITEDKDSVKVGKEKETNL